MSHNLATINGQTAMAYQGEMPWHGLGKTLRAESLVNVIEAMIDGELAGWNVKHVPLYTMNPNISNGVGYTKSKFAQAVYRESTESFIGAVGPKSVPIQNERAFAPLQVLIDDAGFQVETCGALGKGGRVWMLAKAPNSIHPVKGDKIDAYMLAIHAHDGSHALDFVPTLVRVVCNNTWAAAMQSIGIKGSNGRVLKIKHTASSDERITAAGEFMERFGAVCTANEAFLAQLAETPLKPQQVAEIIESVIPIPNGKDSDTLTERRKTIAALVFTGVGAELAGSNLNTGETNAYAVYNAITEYFDHVRPTEKRNGSAIESTLFGANAVVKAKALDVVRELVAV